MSEIKNVGWTWMALNTFKCNYLTPLSFKGLIVYLVYHLALAKAKS